MRLVSIPDFNGDNARHSLSALFASGGVVLDSPMAFMIVVVEVSTGTTNTRIGDINVTTTRGLPIGAAADKVVFPAITRQPTGTGWSSYHMDQIYIWAATGDTISLSALVPDAGMKGLR